MEDSKIFHLKARGRRERLSKELDRHFREAAIISLASWIPSLASPTMESLLTQHLNFTVNLIMLHVFTWFYLVTLRKNTIWIFSYPYRWACLWLKDKRMIFFSCSRDFLLLKKGFLCSKQVHVQKWLSWSLTELNYSCKTLLWKNSIHQIKP